MNRRWYEDPLYQLVMLVVLCTGAILLVLLVVHDARAACDPKKPEHCAEYLNAGDPAPFTGIIQTVPMALAIGQKASSCPERIRLEVARTSSIARVNREADRRVADVELEGEKRVTQIWKDQAEENEPGFWDHPATWFVVGVVATVGMYWLVRGTDEGANRLFEQ